MNRTIHTKLQASHYLDRMRDILDLQCQILQAKAKHGQAAWSTYENVAVTLAAIEALSDWLNTPFSRVLKIPREAYLLDIQEDTITLAGETREVLNENSFRSYYDRKVANLRQGNND